MQRTMRSCGSLMLLSAALASVSPAALAQPRAAAQDTVPLATVPGVTLQTVRLGKGVQVPGSNASQATASTAYADAAGMTLYTYDKDSPGKSACVGECAAAWLPLVAPAQAKAGGGWSILVRDDGSRQWALEGKPLYTSTKDKALGNSSGHNQDGLWHAAVLAAPEGFTTPTEIAVEEVLTAPGMVLVDARKRPLYAFDQKAKGKSDMQDWQPVKASALAGAVGDFTVAKRTDGLTQWVYKGLPLYTYAWDVEPGDSNGQGVDARFQLAVVRGYFMPAGVAIRANQKRGGVLAAADGRTLYARDRVGYTGNGAHNARGGARGNPAVGALIGLSGCDAACEKAWRPLRAPADAETSGFWTVFARSDGTKQWGYQGYAMYSYMLEKPGEVTANDSYQLTINHDTKNLGDANTGFGLYWRVTTP